MKNYDSKFSPFLGAGILGVTTPVAVYLIGLFVMLLWAAVTIFIFPFYYEGHLNHDALTDVMVIVAAVLQVLAVVALTLILSVFSNLKIYHLLISSVISSILFLIAERFIPMVRSVNFPWQMEFFPKLLSKRTGGIFDSLTTKQFVELRLYLTTALILTGTFIAVSLITWGIYRAAAHKKQRTNGSQDEFSKEKL